VTPAQVELVTSTNGTLLCPYRHHLLHRGEYRTRMTRGQPELLAPRWIDPDQIWRAMGRSRLPAITPALRVNSGRGRGGGTAAGTAATTTGALARGGAAAVVRAAALLPRSSGRGAGTATGATA
jgi:hypothetical protein